MFVITLIFSITILIYFCTFAVVYRTGHLLEIVSVRHVCVFVLFLRIYLFNYVINSIVFGFLDPRFRLGIKQSSKKIYNRLSKFQFR